MEYMEKNMDWLRGKLKYYEEENYYFLFDCPGQVELYTNHDSFRNIVDVIQKWNYRVAIRPKPSAEQADRLGRVETGNAWRHFNRGLYETFLYHCTEPANYIAATLMALTTMLHLELPHINVLSKMDLIEKYGKLSFGLEFYTEVMDLKYLRKTLNQTLSPSFRKLNKAMCTLIEDFALVSFHPLDIQSKASMMNLLKSIDKSNGYIYGGLTHGNEAIFGTTSADWNIFELEEKIEDMRVIERDTDEGSDV